MFQVIKNVMESGCFELMDLLGKIDTLWLQGSITDDERQDLIRTARTKADPSHSYAPLQVQIDALAERVAALEAEKNPDGPDEEWPEFVQPTGSHDAYHTGDKVTYNGAHYICIAPEGSVVVWCPDVYPSYWQAQ